MNILPLLKTRVSKIFARNSVFSGIHVFTPSADVPDEFGSGPKLVVLPPAAPYSVQDSGLAFKAAEEILKNRGDQPRQRQNRLLFFSALTRTP